MSSVHSTFCAMAVAFAASALAAVPSATAADLGLSHLAPAKSMAVQVNGRHYRYEEWDDDDFDDDDRFVYSQRYYPRARRYHVDVHRYDDDEAIDHHVARREVILDAPFTHVYVGRHGHHIVAPFVDIWLPRD